MSATEKRTPAQQLVGIVRSEPFQQQVAAALPEGIPPSRFVRIAATALLENPGIAEAGHDSVFASLLKAAADGLLPDGREAALVVFNTKAGPRAQYLPMIGGYRKIAAEHGWGIRTAVVYEHDEFEFELGLDPRLYHRPVRPGMDRGGPVAAYAVGRHRDHPAELEVMTADDIEKVRCTSRSKDTGPWKDWPERMWEKTVGRRLFAKLPLGERDRDRVARVINVDTVAPGEASALLYGPGLANGRAALEASAPVPPVPEAGEQPAAPLREAAKEEEVAASGVDGDPDAAPPSVFDGEPGEETEQLGFVAPTVEARQAQRDAQAAGLTYIEGGKHAGQTLVDFYTAKPKVATSWFSWVLDRPTHPNYWAVLAYARVFCPEAVGGDAS